MYDISGLQPDRKEIAIAILAAVIVMVVIFCAGYLLGVERTKDLHNNGSGIEPIGNELENAGTNIQHAKDGIDKAQGTADKVGAGISNAKESADYISGTVDNSADIIRQCQQIIERVRRRG